MYQDPPIRTRRIGDRIEHWYECIKYCQRGRWVSRATLYNHKPWNQKQQPLPPSYSSAGPSSVPTSLPSGSEAFGLRKRGRADTVVAQNTGGPSKKHRGDVSEEEIDSLDSLVINSNNVDPFALLPNPTAALELEQAEEHVIENTSPPSPDSRSDHVVPSDADDPPDPGSLADCARAAVPPILPRDESPSLNLGEELDEAPHAESPLPPNDCVQPDAETALSRVDSIALSQRFIDALRNASLDESGMDAESVDSLRNPPESPLVIDDPDLRLSLDVFLAITHASNDTYKLVHDAIIRRYPESKILSFDQIKRHVARMSGISPIIHNMCPNSCITYTGPFSELDVCPECHEPRYDQLKLANSKGNQKVALVNYSIHYLLARSCRQLGVVMT